MPQSRLLRTVAVAIAVAVPARVHAVDRIEFPGECHAPVQSTIDPEWRREAMAFKENALRTFARYLDGPEAARQQFQVALQLTDVTRASAFDVIETTKELLIRGFRGKDLVALRWALLDMHAQLGAEKADAFARSLNSAAAMPAVLDGVRKQLREAQIGDAARGALQTCVAAMTKVCPRKEAEAHCRSTPREFMEIMRK